MNRQLLSVYGLKWNPFSPELPSEALQWTPPIEHFAWRVENMTREGGFALISGEVGSGKSVAERLVSERLSKNSDLWVRELSRPQARICDFYRELGELFGLTVSPNNRWIGTKSLRERWASHIESVHMRPVVLIDETQEMPPSVLSELRLLASSHFDAHKLLTVVLCGDQRMIAKLETPDLLPVLSRIRARLMLESLPAQDMTRHIKAMFVAAGNPQLMTSELVTTLTEHAAGNWRALMNMGHELLEAAAHRELAKLDEKLFLEVFAVPPTLRPVTKATATRGKR